jgi:hypothetical protein
MRVVLGGVAAVLSLALAACDLGGGSSSPAPSPTPTPTPTTSPTPAPPPTPITYTTSETALQYTTEGGVQRVANLLSVAPAMGSVFAFTPAASGYTYTLLNGTVNPSPSEAAIFTAASGKVCDVVTLCFGNGFVFQQVPAGAGFYNLSRLVSGPGNPVIVLNFTSFGLFEEAFADATGGPRQHIDLRPFAYGVAADPTTVPTTGTATFNGLVLGQATGNKPGTTGTSNIYQLSGSFQIVADYAAGTATLKLVVAGDATGCTTCPADLSATYNSTAGTLASGVATFTLPGGGSARFFLAGGAVATGSTAVIPATEIAGSFSLTAADPNEAAVTMVLAGSGGGFR